MTQTTDKPNADEMLETERFAVAKEEGQIVDKSGYHQPGGNRPGYNCTCSKTTSKGAYRDVSIKMPDGRTIHYYHQNPIAVETDGATHRWVKISSCGWHTTTTKERLNRYVPAGYRVYQRDWDWYVDTPDGETVDFRDGMVLHKRR